MKMTRPEWRYLQKVALDHPYFDTHKLPLTEKEAKAIVKANVRMTGKEFVDSVYAGLGMTRPTEEKKRFAWLRSIGELFAVPPIRRIAIAVLIIMMMTVFFAATPTGRAIAESVIQYITQIFQDGSIVWYRSNGEKTLISKNEPNPSDLSDDDVYEYYYSDVHNINSFDEFVQQTGKTPYVLPLQCAKLYYYEQDGYLALFAEYTSPNGVVAAIQFWGNETLLSQSATGYTAYSEDDTILYSMDEEHCCIDCVKIFEGSMIHIYGEGSFTLDSLLDYLS